MKLFDYLLNLFFPPKCVFCGEVMTFTAREPLCPVCRSRYQSEKGFPCPECALPHSECDCASKEMKRLGKAMHIAEYVKEESAVRALILKAKDSSYEYLYRFLVGELAALIRKRVPNYADCLLTFVPRGKNKVIQYGVDQAKETARRLAKALGGTEYATLFSRVETKEQKKLTVSERKVNAKKTYAFCPDAKERVKGRRIILYDDVVTSGATMTACASLLKKAGAKEIIFVSFGRTYHRKSKQERGLPKAKKGYYRAKAPF